LSERLALFESASSMFFLLPMITSSFMREISPLCVDFYLCVDASMINQFLVIATMQIQPHQCSLDVRSNSFPFVHWG
jgi:hypothetical protein